MRDPENIAAVCAAEPDYLGFIFYAKSKRYVGDLPDATTFTQVPEAIQKVGVFVNEEAEQVIATCEKYALQVAQLHGNESAEYCQRIKKSGLTVFKAFSVSNDFDFGQLEQYIGTIDYFLFDTKGKLPGGTGKKFNWEILQHYQLDLPFFLSGGIRLEDALEIKALNMPQLYAADINSGFEMKPALKDTEKVTAFIHQIRN